MSRRDAGSFFARPAAGPGAHQVLVARNVGGVRSRVACS